LRRCPWLRDLPSGHPFVWHGATVIVSAWDVLARALDQCPKRQAECLDEASLILTERHFARLGDELWKAIDDHSLSMKRRDRVRNRPKISHGASLCAAQRFAAIDLDEPG
jgi:hypothetical protein